MRSVMHQCAMTFLLLLLSPARYDAVRLNLEPVHGALLNTSANVTVGSLLAHKAPHASKATLCSRIPLKTCGSVHYCELHSERVSNTMFYWCIPKCAEIVNDLDLCESPWCSIYGQRRCLKFDSQPFLQASPQNISYPGWRAVDLVPAGIKISGMPCGPMVGDIMKNFILSRYKKDWSVYWSAAQRKRLYLNGHLMALNGCQRCEVFDTHDRMATDYFKRNVIFNELVVSCLESSCNSPNFFVAQHLANTFESYCHPCPSGCESCKYKHRTNPLQDRTFSCKLPTGVTTRPAGYDCSPVGPRKNAEGNKTICKVRPFYLGFARTDVYVEDIMFPKFIAQAFDDLPAGWGGKDKVKHKVGGLLVP